MQGDGQRPDLRPVLHTHLNARRERAGRRPATVRTRDRPAPVLGRDERDRRQVDDLGALDERCRGIGRQPVPARAAGRGAVRPHDVGRRAPGERRAGMPALPAGTSSATLPQAHRAHDATDIRARRFAARPAVGGDLPPDLGDLLA